MKMFCKKTGGKVPFLAGMILALTLCTLIPDFSHVYAAETDASEGSGVVSAQESPDNVNTQGYDVVYVIDNSKSVWNQNTIRNKAFSDISNLAVGSNIRIGAVYFADHVYDTLPLTSMKDQSGSQKVLDFLDMTETDDDNIDTNIGNALEAAYALFDSNDTSRERIIVLFSDGINENAADDADYKKAADDKTAEEVQILKDENIPIYCVYLQKSRNDEDYLKSLVNYFSDEEDYSAERFTKVDSSEIDTLADTFSNVFYDIQHNMKYCTIDLDASGNFNFKVPSLGVTQLKVYANNADSLSLVSPSGQSDYTDKWTDGSAQFLVYDNPAAGDWTLKATSSGSGSFYGTIAYYVSLQTSVEQIVTDSSADDDTEEYQLVLHFFGQDGQEIAIDDAAKVDVNVMVNDQADAIPLTTTIQDGSAVSDTFSIGYSELFDYDIHVTYEDFVDLNYTVAGVRSAEEASASETVAETKNPEGSESISEAVTEAGSEIAEPAADANNTGASQEPASESPASSDNDLLGLIIRIVLAIAAIAILLLILMLSKKKQKSSGSLDQLIVNIQEQKNACEWTLADFEDEKERLDNCVRELKKYPEANSRTLTADVRALIEEAQPLYEQAKESLTSGQNALRDRSSAKALKTAASEMAKATEELKARTTAITKANSELEQTIIAMMK